MATYSSITCCEEFGSQQENRTLSDWSPSVVLRCAWSSRHALVADLLGNRREWPHGTGDKPRAVSASIVPFPSTEVGTITGQSHNYDDALVTVNYSSNVESDLVSESLEPTVEFQILDYKRFRWGSGSGDPLLEGEAPGKQLRGLNLVRTFYGLSSLPTEILTGVGKVHNASYVSSLLGLTFAADTLLFVPPSLNRTITTAGSRGWTATVKFVYKPETWNKFWRASSGAYESIYLAGSGSAYESYPPANLSALLA